LKPLQGRVTLVTGAARGSGAAIAQALCQAGALVVIGDIDTVAASALAAQLGAQWMALDVRQELAWIGVLARLLDSHGRLDLLVNGARPGHPGAGTAQDPEHTCLADWQAVYGGTLDSVFLGCKHGLRAMRRGGGGTILNCGAAPGGTAAQVASQAALRAHTRSVARYCMQQGLAVRCQLLRHGPPHSMAASALLLARG
jgi:3(or 17)beta-hydroxysteroid dehydrogenase